jgi:protoheme IX farnesyltransferase
MSLKSYYEITKPGIVYGNAIPVIGSFLLASNGQVQWGLFTATVIGIGLVMASSCVFNNVIDRDIDAKMSRTKSRPVVAGRISVPAALAYGTLLGLAGFSLLFFGANMLTAEVAALGFFFYVVMYSMWWKRGSVWGTEIGSVSGAVPAVVGYVAVKDRIDLAAVLLFALMVAWQMPHFYGIAIRLFDDYTAAKIPALPLVRGMHAAKVQMTVYVIAFIAAASLLTAFGYCGYVYLAVVLLFGLAWLSICLKGFRIPDNDKKENALWARRVFLFSLWVLLATFTAMGLSPLLV